MLLLSSRLSFFLNIKEEKEEMDKRQAEKEQKEEEIEDKDKGGLSSKRGRGKHTTSKKKLAKKIPKVERTVILNPTTIHNKQCILANFFLLVGMHIVESQKEVDCDAQKKIIEAITASPRTNSTRILMPLTSSRIPSVKMQSGSRR